MNEQYRKYAVYNKWGGVLCGTELMYNTFDSIREAEKYIERICEDWELPEEKFDVVRLKPVTEEDRKEDMERRHVKLGDL